MKSWIGHVVFVICCVAVIVVWASVGWGVFAMARQLDASGRSAVAHWVFLLLWTGAAATVVGFGLRGWWAWCGYRSALEARGGGARRVVVPSVATVDGGGNSLLGEGVEGGEVDAVVGE